MPNDRDEQAAVGKPAHGGASRLADRLLILPGTAAVRFPIAAALLAVLTVILCGLSISQIRFDTDVIRALSSSGEHSRTYHAFIEEVPFGSSDIVILAESDDVFSTETFLRLRELALDLEFVDGVSAVLSPFSARFPRDHPDFAEEPVIPFDPKSEAVGERLRVFNALPGAITPLLTDGLDSALFLVITEGNDSADSDVFREAGSLISEYEGDGLQLTLTGEAGISAAMIKGMKHDLLVLNLFGGLIGIGFAGWLFRGPRPVATVYLPSVFGALAAVAVFAMTGFPITVINTVIPVFVYILALADSTHLVTHYVSLDRGRPAPERIMYTLRTIGPACALTAVTTAVAFFSISVSGNDTLREFAIVGGCATLLSYVFVVVWFVLLARWLDPAVPEHFTGLPLPPIPAAFKRLALDRPMVVIGAGAVLTVVAAAAALTTTPWFSIYRNLPETSSVRYAAEAVEDRFGGFFQTWVVYEAPERQTPEGWRALIAKLDAFQKAAPAHAAITPATFSDWLGDRSVPPDPDELAEFGSPIVTSVLPPGQDRARAMVLSGDPMRDAENTRRHDAMTAAAFASGAATVTGLPVVMRAEPINMIRQLSLGLFIACLVCVCLIALVYMDGWLAPILLAPNLLPLAVTAAGLHVLQDGLLSPDVMLALTIAFGIAVDDAIHFVNRYRLQREAGHANREALALAIDEVGQVMMATTLLICGGLLVTLTSDFSTVRLFGTLEIMVFVVALLADLLLLPALLRVRWIGREA